MEEPLQRLRADRPLHPAFDEVPGGSFRRRSPPEIVGSVSVKESTVTPRRTDRWRGDVAGGPGLHWILRSDQPGCVWDGRRPQHLGHLRLPGRMRGTVASLLRLKSLCYDPQSREGQILFFSTQLRKIPKNDNY